MKLLVKYAARAVGYDESILGEFSAHFLRVIAVQDLFKKGTRCRRDYVGASVTVVVWRYVGKAGHSRGAPYFLSLQALQKKGFASVLGRLTSVKFYQYSAHQIKYIIGHPLHYFPSREAFAEGGSV